MLILFSISLKIKDGVSVTKWSTGPSQAIATPLSFGWRLLLTACHLPSFPMFQRRLTIGNIVEFCKKSAPVCATGAIHLGPLLGILLTQGYCREMKNISICFSDTEQGGFYWHSSRKYVNQIPQISWIQRETICLGYASPTSAQCGNVELFSYQRVSLRAKQLKHRGRGGTEENSPRWKFCRVHNADHFTQLHEVSHNQCGEWRATGGELPSLHLHGVCAACPGWLHVGSWDLFRQSFWERVFLFGPGASLCICYYQLRASSFSVPQSCSLPYKLWGSLEKEDSGCLFIAHPPPHLHRGFLKSTAIRPSAARGRFRCSGLRAPAAGASDASSTVHGNKNKKTKNGRCVIKSTHSL